MQYSSKQFCPVCSAALIQKMEEKVGSLFYTTQIDENSLRIDNVNIEISGIFEIPERIYEKTVVQIGDLLFANQTQITKIILPTTVTEIGESIFENCVNLKTVDLPGTIQSIGNKAFKGCTSLTNITLPSSGLSSIGNQIFSGCSSLANITIPASVTNIGTGAFAGCNNLNITVAASNPNYSAQGNILYDKLKTKIIATGKINSSITIPETVTEITPYAFEGNSNLTTVHISNSADIGIHAFANCENLETVYFYSYNVPEIGTSAFTGDNFTVYVPYSKQAAYNVVFQGYLARIESLPITITFVKDGVEINTINTYFGATINTLGNTPIKQGYDFAGWYDNIEYTGIKYELGGLWDTTENLTVYAKWTPKVYYINFTGYGTNSFADKAVTYNESIGELPVVTREGYTFFGWKNEYGNYFSEDDIWTSTSNQTVTADLRANLYIITFNGNGGIPSVGAQTIEYDSVITTLANATREGYTFTGWNTAADGNGQAVIAPYTYTTSDHITLYAQYTKNQYVVMFDKQGGNGGINGVDAVFDEPMPVKTLADAPTKAGCTFQGYYAEANGAGIKYYNADMTSAHNWDIAETATLYAYFTGDEYTVTLDKQGGSGGTDEVIATLGEAMPGGMIKPEKIGYTFIGYYTEINGGGIQYYTADMTSANHWNIASNTVLYAAWEPNKYTVILEKQGGEYNIGSNSVEAIYDAPMPTAVKPEKTGYDFQGYYLDPNDEATKYYDANMQSVKNWNIAEDHKVLYAKWVGKQYTVTLKNDYAPKFYSTLISINTSDIIYLGFVPSSSGSITLKTTHTSGNPYLILYDSDFNSLNEDDNSQGSYDAKITYYVVAGVRYYVGFRAYGSATTIGAVQRSGVSVDEFTPFSEIVATYGESMPTEGVKVQTRAGYTFKGYFDAQEGGANYYSGPNLTSVRDWDKLSDATLYAQCEKTKYRVMLYSYGDYEETNWYVDVAYGDTLPIPNNYDHAPTKNGYEFVGYFSQPNGKGTQYYSMELGYDYYYMSMGTEFGGYYEKMVPCRTWDQYTNTTLYAHWKLLECDYTYENIIYQNGYLDPTTIHVKHGDTKNITAINFEGYVFKYFWYKYNEITESTITVTFELKRSKSEGVIYPVYGFFVVYDPAPCVAAGTLITLADGRQVPVETLTGNERLLVWNLHTGKFDTAPILFIDSDPAKLYKVINLYFSDGTCVKTISEHAFWDIDLNQYVYLREDAAQYIGHWFNKQITKPNGKLSWKKVKLTNVVVQEEYTSAWSPVTYSHLCYYVNGMLSMPGGITGLFNIFDVDARTMKYDQTAMAADIAEYGLFTYEEFAAVVPVSEEVFEAFNGQYLKVAIGKGLISIETLELLVARYGHFFE